jgi:uncharacterized membrane-anchored protein YitT (DUF2179 family)
MSNGSRQGDIKNMNSKSRVRKIVAEYLILTIATVVMVVGIYIFRFPNHFTFGGLTGLSIVLSAVTSFHASTIILGINIILMIIGFIVLGRAFTIKSVYVTLLYSVLISILERLWPLEATLTDEPILELVFAVLIPAVASAVIFNFGASSGGTDIVAMILRKYTNLNIGVSLLIADFIIVTSACFVFDIKTGLFSFCGMLAKSLVIDNIIESVNQCKCFNVICTQPEPICRYICDTLHRDATVYEAKGAFTGQKKMVVMTAMRRWQAMQLRNFIKKTDPAAFILISNTSEIIGKGFHGVI